MRANVSACQPWCLPRVRLSMLCVLAVALAQGCVGWAEGLEDYRISPGDMLGVHVFGEEQFTSGYRVGPTGTITLALVGAIEVGDRTLKDAELAIRRKLRRVLKRPYVTVGLDEVQSQRKVYVSGYVETQGPLLLPFGATVVDAVAAAGVTSTSDLRRVRVTHGGEPPQVMDLSGLRAEAPIDITVEVRYGDVIYVPKITDEITLVGQVNNPGQALLPVGEEMTVLKAIARLGGGLTASADKTTALLVREGETVARIDLKKLLQEGDLSQNLALQAGDVLVVREAGKVSVVGEVNAPATFEIGEPITVLDALARAGSTTVDADLAEARLLTEQGAVPVDLEGLIRRGEMQYNVTVNPGDVLLIPRAKPETVLIVGAVERAGVINIREEEQRDLLRLLTAAGPTEMADLSRTYVYRRDERIVVDMNAVMKQGAVELNLELEPDDIVMVPELKTIYVLGAVTASGAFPLTEDMRLIDVISKVGSYQTGNLAQTTVIRTEPDGTTELIVRDMASMNRGVAPEELVLEEGDIIYVPPRGKEFNWSSLRNVLYVVGALIGIFGL